MSAHPPAPPRPSRGLAVAALILGLLGLFSSVLVVGGVLGFFALVFGALHLRRGTQARGVAVSGIALGLVAMMASAGAFVAYRHLYRTYGSRLNPFDRLAGRRAHTEWIGTRAPAFAFTTLAGEAVELRQFHGRPVVLNFWATWCGPCRKELPHLNRLAREMPEVTVLCISDEDEETVREFATEHPFDARVASVLEPPPPFDDIHAVPTTVFIDDGGAIRDVRLGSLSYDTLHQIALASAAASTTSPKHTHP